MQDVQKIIEQLNQSGPTSGVALGSALGISRMAVQKRMQGLIELGLPVSASPGVGYRLEDGITLLDAQRIKSQLVPAVSSLVSDLEVFQTIESTNNHLLINPIQVGRARACLAETQSAGRGRRGNDWQSAPYRNMMLSVSWGFDHWPATITGLGLAVGLAVAEYLNGEYDAGVTIKWPNDILVDGDKLGGILVDVAGESTGACNVVIGLGLNVHQPDWSTDTKYRWSDLASLGIQIDRNVLASDLVSILTAMLMKFSQEGFSPLVERWNQLSSYANKTIRVGTRETGIIGQMAGVDETGALLLCVGSEIKRIDDSAVSVRLVD